MSCVIDDFNVYIGNATWMAESEVVVSAALTRRLEELQTQGKTGRHMCVCICSIHA
jgi:hypothetical protein